VRGRLDRVKKRLNFAFDKRRRFTFSPRKSLGFDFPGRIHGQDAFFGKPGKHHPNGGHVLLDRSRRSLALQRFDVGRNRDGLNLFNHWRNRLADTSLESAGRLIFTKPNHSKFQ
jgi:hypothetical protein